MSRSSITSEIDAVYAKLETTGEGLDAFRQGGIAMSTYAQDQPPSTSINALVSVAVHSPSTNEAVEAAKSQYPDEFALGAAVNAYHIKRANS